MQAELTATAAAVHDSWMRSVALATGGRVLDFDGTACVHQPLPHDEVLIPFPGDVPPETIARVMSWARAEGIARIGCWASGLGDTTAVAATLTQFGFREAWQPHWMARALSTEVAPPAAVRIDEVSDVPEYDAYGQGLLSMARGARPSGRHFVARFDGTFAGMAWLYVSETAPGVGGIFDVFVTPSHRRRGVARALTAAVCVRAREIGCRHVVLNATGEGEGLYRALGFESLGFGRTWWLDIRS